MLHYDATIYLQLDVHIADTKLSANTAFTTNQKDAMKLIPGQFNIRTC